MAVDAEGVFAAGDPNPEQTNPEPTSNPEPVAEEKPKESKKKAPNKESEKASEEKALEELRQRDIPKQIVAESIRLVSPSGKSVVTLQASDDIAGLWIEASPEGDKYPRSCVAIYDDKNSGPVIGFYRDIGEDNLAMHFAICLDEHGIPQLQVDNGRGGFGHIGLAALLDHLKPDWR